MRKALTAVAALSLALALFPCSLCSSFLSPSSPPSDAGTAGQALAPDFTLERLGGGSVTLSDLRGQVVVVDFWASWCGPCVESMPHLQELHERYAGQGVVVLAVNVEEPDERVARFVEEGGYTFTVLLDRDGAVAEAYGVWGIPYTVVVDREGGLHTVFAGPEGAEEEVQRQLGQ